MLPVPAGVPVPGLSRSQLVPFGQLRESPMLYACCSLARCVTFIAKPARSEPTISRPPLTVAQNRRHSQVNHSNNHNVFRQCYDWLAAGSSSSLHHCIISISALCTLHAHQRTIRSMRKGPPRTSSLTILPTPSSVPLPAAAAHTMTVPSYPPLLILRTPRCDPLHAQNWHPLDSYSR